MPKPRITRSILIRLPRLLDMLYKPSELAKEIGVSVDTVYDSYIPAGLPYIQRSHSFWIHGPAFADWAHSASPKKKKPAVPSGMAWCMKCNQLQPMHNPRQVYQNYKIVIDQSTCPVCGCRINRFASNRRGAA